ncbi:MAG: DpnI domain-containing protein [Candidatus Acidiferrales bacterium]
MDLCLPSTGLKRYKSASQRARVGTESWGATNFFCPACKSPRLRPEPLGTAAIDFVCPICDSPFQLKSQSKPFGSKIVDAAYSAMVRAIRENRTPNLFALRYEPTEWRVADLIVIPYFAFPLSAIEKRKPLSPNARRARWVGCNILVGAIPFDAKIPIIANGIPVSPESVRRQYARIRPLEKLKSEQRGWTLDVLNVVRSLAKTEFELNDVYAFEDKLARLHPANRHVRDKIRQQLQVLRDLGLLEFLGDGAYRLR